MFSFLKRWFGGSSATMYEPGTGRIVAARSDSGAGVNVTVETSLSIPAIFHGLRTYGQVIGARKWDLIEHKSVTIDGVEHRRQEVARMHPVHRLLHSEPNEFQNASEWRETMIAHAILTGGGFSYIQRNGNYRPTALLPLMPDRTRPMVNNGVFSYQTVVKGQTITLQPDEVYHLKGFSWDGVNGIPLWKLMRDTLGLDKAQAQFAAQFYRNGANMGGIIEMPDAMTDVARQNIKESMAREYGGLGNAFRTLFLEEGMKYTKTGVEPDKAQFIEGRQYSLGELARVIGLPPHLLYDLSRSTNNNIEHQGIAAVVYSFEPWTNKLCQEANRKLLYESEKFDFETRIDLKPLQQGDALSQAQVKQIEFNTLAITPNEIRGENGRNPQPGGDSLYLNTAILPLNVAIQKALAVPAQPGTPDATTTPAQPAPSPMDDDADDNEDTPPGDPSAGDKPPADDEPQVPAKLIDDERALAIRPVLRDALSRITQREANAIEKALTKHMGDVDAFRTWFADWQQEQPAHIAKVMQPACDTAAALSVTLASDYAARHLAQTAADVEAILAADSQQRPTLRMATFARWSGERIENAISILEGKTHE